MAKEPWDKKELLNKIEESRYRLCIIDPLKKEKLLRESRKLDLLILEYYAKTKGKQRG